jgi:hypothetical protein
MRKKSESTPRESAIASGWTVSGDASESDDVKAGASGASVTGGASDVAGETKAPDTAKAPDAAEEMSADARDTVSAASRAELSNSALVLYGVFGGMYLLYTVGWFLIAQYFASANNAAASTSGIIGGILQVTIYWAAALAPGAWFATVYFLARQRKPWFFPTWLIVGLVILLPLPLFTTGGA